MQLYSQKKAVGEMKKFMPNIIATYSAVQTSVMDNIFNDVLTHFP